MPRWYSRAQHAKEAGVSKAAVTKWAKGLPDAAKRGQQLDADHPDVTEHRERQERPRPEPTDAPEEPADYGPLESYLDMSIRQIAERFETDAMAPVAFKEYVDLQKKIEDTRRIRLDNDETEGALVRRKLIDEHIFGMIEGLFLRLLGDTVRTIVARVYAAAKSGQEPHEAQEVVRDLIGKQLRSVKAKAVRVLRA